MFEEATLGEGWQVWNAEADRAILAYRPDVFDGSTFPSPCLPTVYVSRGRLNRRPQGNRNLPPDAPWLVRLRLEPDVGKKPETYDSREAAFEGAVRLTHRFSTGEIDRRSLYDVPRESYLDALDSLLDR